MATQDVLDQLGNSSSTSDDDEDDATSSEDENAMGLLNNGKGSTVEPMKIDKSNDPMADPMQIDSPSSEAKPRISIKLKMRASVAPNDVSTAAPAEATNGIKKETVHGRSDESDKPPRVLMVKQEPHNTLSSFPPATPQASEVEPTKPASTEKPSKTLEAAVKAEAISSTNAEKPRATNDRLKPNKAEAKAKKEGKPASAKVKKPKVKSETSASNGTSKGPAALSAGPPKKKPKKKLSKLPLSTKRKLPLKAASVAPAPLAQITLPGTVKATVVDCNELVDDVLVATVVENTTTPVSAAAVSAAKLATAAALAEKKRQQPKPIRLPPMTSPGLLIHHVAAATYKSALDESGFAKPGVIFEQSMAQAGYTTEGRTNHPHRGSSVKRVVGDMFDSDVGFAVNFPELVPNDLWKTPSEAPGQIDGRANGGESKPSLPLVLMKSLKQGIKDGEHQPHDDTQANGKDGNSRKRQRPWEFREMLPVSLTIPYPDSFTEKRLQWVKEVDQREQAIVAHQEAQEKLEIDQEEKEFLYGKEGSAERPKIENPVKIPPIPTPPSPPSLSEFKGLDADQYEGTHPIYFARKNFVSHLEQRCFHITEGRYFGLGANTVADPHFVGSSAPGIVGLPVTVASGLATASTSAGSLKSDSVLANPPSTATAASKTEATSTAEKTPTKKEKEPTAAKPVKKTASLPTVVKPSSTSKFKLKHVGPTATAKATDLRKVMDQGGEMADKMRQCIIRAAVHASRSGKHGQSFLAPDGKAYPDVSKAFAAHGGLKPCARCKNNKQGAYHCRLRRKHKEVDHDGSNSPAELAPLLQLPMEDLLIQPKDTK